MKSNPCWGREITLAIFTDTYEPSALFGLYSRSVCPSVNLVQIVQMVHHCVPQQWASRWSAPPISGSNWQLWGPTFCGVDLCMGSFLPFYSQGNWNAYPNGYKDRKFPSTFAVVKVSSGFEHKTVTLPGFSIRQSTLVVGDHVTGLWYLEHQTRHGKPHRKVCAFTVQ